MDLQWEDLPVPEAPFFTREQYDVYSLAPNMKELWALAQSSAVKGHAETQCEKGGGGGDMFTNHCSTSQEGQQEEEKSWSNCDSSAEDISKSTQENHNDNKQSKKKGKKGQDEVVEKIDFPEPRLPYPYISNLTVNDQKHYLYMMSSKTPKEPNMYLKATVNSEVAEFMKYLHNVSKLCPDDYNYITQGALKYSEDFYMACIENLASLPHLYQICEMTSLTGGTFDQGLALTFEKELLIMGSVDIGDHDIVAADAQLATDYQSVSSQTPPAKKARDKCAPISSDANAEKLSSHYEPHVCLTQDALVTLLDNHGPEFCTPWELPVQVKVNPGKAPQQKTVYIDPPLLQTEVTDRERSLVFHEESLKLSLNNHGKKAIALVITETPASETPGPRPDYSKRGTAASEDKALDFSDVDVTDLETFGDTTVLPLKEKQKPTAVRKVAVSGGGPAPEDAIASSQEKEEMEDQNVTDTEDAMEEEEAGDSEDERLVIDDALAPAKPKTTATVGGKGTVTSTPVPRRTPRQNRAGGAKMAGAAAPRDPLGEILRMQSAMLKPKAKDASKGPPVAAVAAAAALGSFSPPSGRGHPTSLVKPCVTSYLESQNQDREVGGAAVSQQASSTAEYKKLLLPAHLQKSAEDTRDYQAPEEGCLLYKLYGLQDLLLLVRSSLALTYTHAGRNGINRFVPVHVLPKMEYQLSYGVECLSSGQACELWAHRLLHSSTISYVAHISAHTSKLALLRRLTDDWQQKLTCDFRPAKSLNILHHMLKKLSRLDEGRYLIRHKAGEPFVTIYRAGPSEKLTRGTYDLRQAHGAAPRPRPGPAPWLPVDSAVVLPFHRSNDRVPCTFPPRTAKAGKGNGLPAWSNSYRTRKSDQGPANTNTNSAAKNKNKKNKNKNKNKKKSFIHDPNAKKR